MKTHSILREYNPLVPARSAMFILSGLPPRGFSGGNQSRTPGSTLKCRASVRIWSTVSRRSPRSSFGPSDRSLPKNPREISG